MLEADENGQVSVDTSGYGPERLDYGFEITGTFFLCYTKVCK